MYVTVIKDLDSRMMASAVAVSFVVHGKKYFQSGFQSVILKVRGPKSYK